MSSNKFSKKYFSNGLTELLILAILVKEDSYAYDIVKKIKKLSNGKILISVNTVYCATYRLLNEGKISQYSKLVGKRRKRMYCHLKDEGRNYYLQLLDDFRAVYSGVEQIIGNLSYGNEQTDKRKKI